MHGGLGTNQDTLLLVCFTQILLAGGNVLALFLFRRYIAQINPAKRWRHIAIMGWLSIGVAISFLQAITILIGCPPLPVMRLLLWMDRTILMSGYLAIIVTAIQLRKLPNG